MDNGVYLRTRRGKRRYIRVKDGIATILASSPVISVPVEELDKGDSFVWVREIRQ